MANITAKLVKDLSENIGKVIFGKEKTVEELLCALLSGGHVLLEDVPGTGKTSLVRALSASFGGTYKRVQFTPDLLPSDITGINYYQQNTGEFVFRQGPIFANLFLADEINRATPRTQSALVECMEEGQVTVDGETRELSDVFMVMATMNPIEFQGTFPLPVAQIDRVMMKLHLGYPDEDGERRIVEKVCGGFKDTDIEAVATVDDLLGARREIASVYVSDEVRDDIVRLVRATRESEKIKMGVSPRGVVALTKACRAYAAIQGRDHILPDDVKRLAVSVLAHRLIPRSQSNIHLSQSGESLIEYLLTKIPVSLEKR